MKMSQLEHDVALFLINNPGITVAKASELYGCCEKIVKRVRKMIHYPKAKRSNAFTAREDSFILSHVATMTSREIGERLGRSVYAIKQRRKKICK